MQCNERNVRNAWIVINNMKIIQFDDCYLINAMWWMHMNEMWWMKCDECNMINASDKCNLVINPF